MNAILAGLSVLISSHALAAKFSVTIEPESGSVETETVRLKLEGDRFPSTIKELSLQLSEEVTKKAAELAAVPQIVYNSKDFYVEARAARNLVLEVNIESPARELGGSTVSYQLDTLPIESAEDLKKVYNINGFSRLTVYFSAERELYKCFNPETCVFQAWSDRSRSVANFAHSNVEDVIRSKSIGNSASTGVTIEESLFSPGQYLIQGLPNSLSRELEIFRSSVPGSGQSSSVAKPFVGFAGNIGSNSFRTLHVFPTAEGLKLKVVVKPYYNCVYTRTVSYTDTFYVPTAIGQSCGSHPQDRTYFSHAEGAVDHEYSKEATIQDFKLNGQKD